MLCTRMHLAERRLSLPREPRESAEGVPSARGVVQRPCIIRNVSGNFGSVVTPRNLDRSKMGSNRKKPSLVIFSLKMQPGIKTLAQDTIKRDPRRLPTFCEQYKQAKRERAADERPHCDLIVRGVELLGDHSAAPEPGEGDEFIPRELQVQLTDCCQCMRDFNFLQRGLEFHPQLMHQSEMHLREEPRRLEESQKQEEIATDIKIVTPCVFGQKRIPTPRTRQVIKITVNSRKNESPKP